MPQISDVKSFQTPEVENQLSNNDTSSCPGWLFKGQTLYFAHNPQSGDSQLHHHQQQRLNLASNIARFASARVVTDLEVKSITHIIVCDRSQEDISSLRKSLSKRVGTKNKIPHIVSVEWIEQSWAEKTLLDEERKCFHHLSLERNIWRFRVGNVNANSKTCSIFRICSMTVN